MEKCQQSEELKCRPEASALAKDYGMKDVPSQGPVFKAAKFECSSAVVSSDNPICNLYIHAGFHAAPFRTDN